MATAEYHFALFQLWKHERAPWIAAEAHFLEERVRRDVRRGAITELGFQVLYNGVCRRVLMMQQGDLDAAAWVDAMQLLEEALTAAGTNGPDIARWLMTDADLAEVREMPFFASAMDRARTSLGQSSACTHSEAGPTAGGRKKINRADKSAQSMIENPKASGSTQQVLDPISRG
jgi:hypothetical protein